MGVSLVLEIRFILLNEDCLLQTNYNNTYNKLNQEVT